jgi:hypothetical protein
MYIVADKIPPRIRIAPLLGWHSMFSICFLVYISLLHKFRSLGIGFGLRLVGGWPKLEYIFEGVKITQGILLVAQCCVIWIEHTYTILMMLVCTQLHNSI